MTLSTTIPAQPKFTNYFASVEILDGERLQVITKTLRIWKRFLTNYVSHHQEKGLLDERSKLISADYLTVVGLLQSTVFQMRTRPHIKLLAAKDLKEEIQAMSCFSIGPKAPTEAVCIMRVSELITAPWNLRLTYAPHPEPLYGGGVLLMHAMFQIAKKSQAQELKLHSTPTSITFYKKLGMSFDGINRFTFSTLSKEHKEALDGALLKVLMTEELRHLALED